jgi:phosphatidylethanolamine/phosphatidyl-N-methylethanolamine N-methyltransferase
MSLPGLRLLEKKFEAPIRLFELKRSALEKQIERQLREFEQKRNIHLDDDLRFIRSWLAKPLAIGAVAPSSKVLARTMAQYVDPDSEGPVVELGPGTGPVTQALVQKGVDPSRLVLIEFNTAFCRLLRARYPQATVVQGDAYSLRRLLEHFLYQPAAAIVSGLPLMTKPARTRVRLITDALSLLAPGAPFVQFTYAVVSPLPGRLVGVRSEASDRIWLNMPPARVWVYRRLASSIRYRGAGRVQPGF